MFRFIQICKPKFGTIKNSIESTLKQKLSPKRIQIIDESSGHSRGTQTHFNAYIVSQKFENLSKINRHKLVYTSLGELMTRFHALSLTCKTQSQELSQPQKNQSPGCSNKRK